MISDDIAQSHRVVANEIKCRMVPQGKWKYKRMKWWNESRNELVNLAVSIQYFFNEKPLHVWWFDSTSRMNSTNPILYSRWYLCFLQQKLCILCLWILCTFKIYRERINMSHVLCLLEQPAKQSKSSMRHINEQIKKTNINNTIVHAYNEEEYGSAMKSNNI